MDSHDKSLKCLLNQDPAAFIGFALRDPRVRVRRPVATDLPARGRTLDGGYLIQQEERSAIIQIEFMRRHQSRGDVAWDLGEAQLRLRRREGVPVYSHLWDLYGDPAQPVLSGEISWLGRDDDDQGSQVRYLRVNLRGLSAAQLLDGGPAALWPLVALTRDGASAEAVVRAVQAIEGRTGLSPGQRADSLAALYFLAAAGVIQSNR
jgi:hypothetical protein